MPYKAECSSCGWIFKESESSKIRDMPTTCIKCKGDMRVAPCMNKDQRDYSYELIIQCKENGATMLNGFVMKNEDLININKNGARSKFVARASETFARIVSDANSVNRLIDLNNSKAN